MRLNDPNCLIYSFGLNREWSYEEDMQSRGKAIVRWLTQAHVIILNLSDHHPFLHTFFPYGSESAQLAETERPEALGKNVCKIR